MSTTPPADANPDTTPADPARRRLLAGAAAIAGGAALAGAAQAAAPVRKSNEIVAVEQVIDFRVRPPFRGFRAALHRDVDTAASDDELMERFLADMAAARIGRAVAMGRMASGSGVMEAAIANADVVALVRRYPRQFVGFGAVDVRAPKPALDEIDRCADAGLRGIAFDNPLSAPPLYDDDPSLFPLYERCARRGLIISLTSSVMVGPDMSYSMPVHIQRVGLAFPQTPVVVPHAAWPWTTQMIAAVLQGVMFKLSNIYLMPDFYLSQAHAPGRQDYIDAANFGLAGRILFASSYPALPLQASVEAIRAIDFVAADTARRILFDNAAALLGV